MFRFFNKNQRKNQSNILERNGDCVIYRYLIRGMLPENDHYINVKGYYISDEYALSYETGYYHIDHIPTSRCVSELYAFDYRREDAINEARRIAGLPEIHLFKPIIRC